MSDGEATVEPTESVERTDAGRLFDEADLQGVAQPVGAAVGCALVAATAVAIVEPRTAGLESASGAAVLLLVSVGVVLAGMGVRSRTTTPAGRGAFDGASVAAVGVTAFALLAVAFEPTYFPLFGAFVVLGLTFGCTLYPVSRGEHPFLGMIVAPAPLAGVAAGVAAVDLGVRGVGTGRLVAGAEALVPITAVLALLTVWFAYVIERVTAPSE